MENIFLASRLEKAIKLQMPVRYLIQLSKLNKALKLVMKEPILLIDGDTK